MTHPKHDYKDYPKTVPEEDFCGQVRRTVNGKPVPEEQIKMIVDAILAGLALRPEDNCLDIYRVEMDKCRHCGTLTPTKEGKAKIKRCTKTGTEFFLKNLR